MANYKILLIITIILSTLIIFSLVSFHERSHKTPINQEGLLSSRVYANLLDDQSRLIFNLEPLEVGIKEYIFKSEGLVGVYLLNLRDGASLEINDEILFEPASLNKLPIAILTFRDIEKGEIKLDSKILVEKRFIDSTSGRLFEKVGQNITIKEAIDEMLVNSDNTAARILFERIEKEKWESLSNYLDYYENGQNSVLTSPESNVNLFTSLYLSTILEKEDSEYILQKLTESSFPIHELANIPENIKIAQKFGTYYKTGEKYYHNCGIIYFQNSRFAYCIMTQGVESGKAEEIIGNIMEATYKYLSQTKESIEKSEKL